MIAAAVVPFIAAAANGYTLDDVFIVQRNPLVQAPVRPWQIFTSDYWLLGDPSGLYRPLTIMSFALQAAVTLNTSSAYHALNILLHALTAVLLFLLACRFVSVDAATVAALWFATVPVHTEVVAGLVGRSDLLVAFFTMAALFLAANNAHGARSIRRGIVAGILIFLALLSKESAIPAFVLVAALLLVEQRPAQGFAGWQARSGERLRSLLANPAFWCVTIATIAYVVIRIRIVGLLPQNISPLLNPAAFVDSATRIRTAVTVTTDALGHLVWPFRLAPDYSCCQLPPVDSWLSARFIGALFLLISIVGAVVMVRGRYKATDTRALCFGVTFFGLAWLPVSGFLFPIGTIYAERLMYLPSVGAAIVVGWLFQQAWANGATLRTRTRAERRLATRRGMIDRRWYRHPHQLVCMGVVGSIFVVYAFGSNRESRYWKDNLALFSMGVKRAPNSALMHRSLGSELANLGRMPEAEQEFRRSLRIYPEDVEAALDLARVLSREGRLFEALPLARTGFERHPSQAAFELLANMELQAGNYRRVLTEGNRLTELKTPHSRMAIGLAHLRLGQINRALPILKALASDLPEDARAQLYYREAAQIADSPSRRQDAAQNLTPER